MKYFVEAVLAIAALKVVGYSLMLGRGKYPRKYDRNSSDDIIYLLSNLILGMCAVWVLFR